MDTHKVTFYPTAFLDRDGVLNACSVDADGVPHPPLHASEIVILDGVDSACARLREAGYLLVCVTNQPDVSRGVQTRERIEAINAMLVDTLKLDAIYVCYHDNKDNCDCRKPKPGMLLQAMHDFSIDPARSFMVGDRSGDILAGAAARVRTFLIDRAYSKREQCQPDFVVESLSEAADIVLSSDGGKG